jgi:hypothetical protein
VPAAVLGGGLEESAGAVDCCFLGGEAMVVGPSRSLDSMVMNIRFMSIRGKCPK